MPSPNRPSSSRRGYDKDHQRRRAALLPYAYGQPCPLCLKPMLRAQPLDLDHSTPLAINPNAKGDRIVHRHCNRSRGAGLRDTDEPRTSRSW